VSQNVFVKHNSSQKELMPRDAYHAADIASSQRDEAYLGVDRFWPCLLHG